MTIRVRTLAAAALLLVLAPCLGCRTTYPSPADSGPTGVYRVGPPDSLLITVLPEPLISRSVKVRPDGMISFDLVGDVPVAGRTVTEIAEDMERRIARYKRDASVTVFLAGSSSTTVTILGQAGRQTTFALPRDTRLIEVIGAVGGWSPTTAAASRIRIIRLTDGEPEVFGADLNAIVKGDLRTNYLLRGGDIIFIPRNVSATIGLAVAKALFPLSSIISLSIQGGRIAIMVQSGGTAALASKAFGGVPLAGLAGGL